LEAPCGPLGVCGPQVENPLSELYRLCHWLNNGDIVGMNWDVRKCLLDFCHWGDWPGGEPKIALELIPSNRLLGSALFPEICPRTTWFNAFSVRVLLLKNRPLILSPGDLKAWSRVLGFFETSLLTS